MPIFAARLGRFVLVAFALALAGCGGETDPKPPGRPSLPRTRAVVTPVRDLMVEDVVVIMQENLSFDSYFCMYRGAVGIPGLVGNQGKLPCIPDPRRGGCDR